ncbi:MAG: alpha/beta fold hydrolase [Kiritimatiellaeota bacterium]|nr:alpha/beta fold hydrolase [Kiritimatiellota bacterium]
MKTKPYVVGQLRGGRGSPESRPPSATPAFAANLAGERPREPCLPEEDHPVTDPLQPCTPAVPRIGGALLSLPLPGRHRPLDGFWVPGWRRQVTLLIIVHGLGGNFYRSTLKKAWLRQGPRHGFDVLSFNNRGADRQVANERFGDCLADLDAALRCGRRLGYRRFILLGHSTGCQKITYYQARRQPADVAVLVLVAPVDDLAVCRRDLGPRYAYWLRRARGLVRQGRGNTLLPMLYEKFSARRFLSIADPRSIEAQIFDYDGPLRSFRAIRCPVLACLGTREEFACRPVAEMGTILRQMTRAQAFHFFTVPGADHGFHSRDAPTVLRVLRWLRSQCT